MPGASATRIIAAITMMLAVVPGFAACTDSTRVPSHPEREPSVSDQHPCEKIPDATCATLTVPLDRSERVPGTLDLQVIMANNADAPHGTLLFFTGGPGQPGEPFFLKMRERLPNALEGYRLVMMDQRGTGGTAIDCPDLQKQVGSSDIAAPTADAMRKCAESLGVRRNFYRTTDTIADFEDLRKALRLRKWALDGVSYGTFTAMRYALAHPQHVQKMVLDSFVPTDNASILYEEAMSHSAFTLRTACAEQKCGFDPASELAKVVRREGNGIEVLDLLVAASVVDPKLTQWGLLDRIKAAASGDMAPLNETLDFVESPTPLREFSSGLHAATLCSDLGTAPWGNSAAPPEGRADALRDAANRLPDKAFWPFDRSVGVGQGIAQTCLHWLPSRPTPVPPEHTLRRLRMPVLVLAGDRDLSTPMSWAKEFVSDACGLHQGTCGIRLEVVPGAGHSVQRRDSAGSGLAERFLLD